MIVFTAGIRSAKARSTDAITTASVGIPVTLALANDFDGLAKTAVFTNGQTSVDVVLVGDAASLVVPPDVLQTTGQLYMGIYAADGEGNIVIPTVWAYCGTVLPGTVPSGVDPSEPTPSWVAQVQSIASEAMETAQSVRTDADNGEFDGFSPTVTVTEITGGHKVTITDVDGEHTFDVMDGQGGGGTDGVFFATYGTTTSAQIEAAYQSGKAVYCYRTGGRIYALTSRTTETYHRFGLVLDNTAYFAACNNDVWSDASRSIPERGDATPKALGTAAVGTSFKYAREDHVHTKPTYTKSNVGLGNVANERQYSANNPPPYPVTSVNSKTGAVSLSASDVGAYALPSGGIPKSDLASDVQTSLGKADTALQSAPVTSVNGQTGAVTVSVPSASSATPQALGTAAAGSSGDFSRADHVHAKPTYSKSDVGLGNVDNVQQYSATNPPPYPVTSVNGSTGAVTLSIPSSASDVGAIAAPSSPATGAFLVWNGSAWVAQTLATWQASSY